MKVLMIIMIASCIIPMKMHELQILHPSSLIDKFRDNGLSKGQTAVIASDFINQGIFDSHKIFRGRVHYPINNQYGCKPFKESDFNHNHLKEASLDGH